jgi:hypothetical protein
MSNVVYPSGKPERKNVSQGATRAGQASTRKSNVTVKEGRVYNTRLPQRAGVAQGATRAGTADAQKKSRNAQMSAAERSELRRFSNKAAADRTNKYPSLTQAEETFDEGSIVDEYGIGGGGGGGGSVRSFSDAQIAAAQARLQAIYSRYADDIAAQEAAIGQTYDTAGTALGSIYDTSVGNINKAYDAARAAQTQQLLNLGMTEQTPVQSFGNQTAATTSLQNLRAAVLAQNEATRKASITNQRLSAEAARRQGTETVAQAVAEMQAAMTPVSGGGGGGGGLTPYQAASLRLRESENRMAAEQKAAEMVANQRRTPNLQAAINNAAKTPLTRDQIAAIELQMKYGPN